VELWDLYLQERITIWGMPDFIKLKIAGSLPINVW
jgi:hypothetical protein